MSQRLTRRQIKRDEVGEALSRTMAFLSGHLKLVAVVAVAVVLLFLLGMSLDRLIGGRRDRASDALAEAIQITGAPLVGETPPSDLVDLPVFTSAEERSARSRELFESIVEKYGSSKSGRIARSYLATLAFEGGDFETARGYWQELARGDDNALAVQAELNLISLDRSTGRADAVEARLAEALERGGGVLPADALLFELAVTQEMLGKTEESTANFRRLLDEYPRSVYGPEARLKAEASPGAGT